MSDITPSDPLNSDQDDSAEKPDSRLRFRNFDEGGKMSFFEHLNELRIRIIHSAIAIALGAFIGFAVAWSRIASGSSIRFAVFSGSTASSLQRTSAISGGLSQGLLATMRTAFSIPWFAR